MAEATPRIIGQRDEFFEALYPIFQQDKKCIIITADNGAPSLDQFSRNLPSQFIQVGIAEQQMCGMAAGLATEGYRVYIYAIAPFVTTRIHEFVKLDVCAANLPITILGIGAGCAYAAMGPSHHTLEDVSIMRVLPNLEIWSPADSVCAAALAKITYERNRPCYIRFDRSGVPDLYDEKAKIDFSFGWSASGTNLTDVSIITTGVMVHRANEVREILVKRGIDATVVDVFRLKPFPEEIFADDYQPDDLIEGRWMPIVTLEEHFLAGGLGSIVAEIIADRGLRNPLLRLGRTDENGFCFEYGGREAIQKTIGLDADSVCKNIQEWLKRLQG